MSSHCLNQPVRSVQPISAAGLYVGLTRGTDDNTLHVIAATEAEAREQFVTAMTRDRADRGLDHAAAEAHAATRGLITDGPVAFVNTERERLAEAITHAETQAARWEQAEVAITVLRHTHATEREEHKTVATAAEQHAQQVREEVIARLAAEALTDGQTVLTSQEEVWDAGRALQQAGRLRRRSAARIRDNANHAHDRLQAVVQQRWGSVPRTPESLDAWAHTVAENQAEQHPAVVDAERELQDTKTAAGQVARKQLAERAEQIRSIEHEERPQADPHRERGIGF